ncbi:hypothetical protein D3C80_1116900 [compost metagenome]
MLGRFLHVQLADAPRLCRAVLQQSLQHFTGRIHEYPAAIELPALFHVLLRALSELVLQCCHIQPQCLTFQLGTSRSPLQVINTLLEIGTDRLVMHGQLLAQRLQARAELRLFCQHLLEQLLDPSKLREIRRL